MNSFKDFTSPFTLYDFFGYFFPGLFFILILVIEYDGGDLMNYYVNNNCKAYSLEGIAEYSNIESKTAYVYTFLSGSDAGFKFIPFVALVMLAYLMGHIIASISSLVLEYGIVHFILGYPSLNLLTHHENMKWYKKVVRWITTPFCTPFEKSFIHDFDYILKSRFGSNVHPRNYYWLCFTDLAK